MAIRVAHHLQEKNIPAYFVSVRGMESKEDLVSKLLSMFADDKRVRHISSSHLIIQYLQQVQNPFVLILDNADDLLESGETRRKDVLQFIEHEILAHCKQIKLLLTTRESLDYLKHKLPMYSEKINELDEISSADLVRLLLPDASDDDCNCIVRECGNVPMSMRLMCSVIKEASISINYLLQDLKKSTLVKVLDSEYLPDGVGIKSVINTSFKRLKIPERNAFVSLSVFPEWFGIEEAQAILNVETQVETKQIIRSLERKSLLDCGENFSHFTVHSLLRSFIEEEIKNDEAVEAVFRDSKTQFYDYYISSCKDANENFLRKHYGDAFRSFLDRRSSIISSISNGPQIDRIYTKAVELLSEAKSFLSVVLHHEQLLIEGLYDTAVKEAKRRGKTDDEQRLHSARECHTTAESYFWLSRVQREEGNLKRAQESAKMGSRLRKELLGHYPHTAVSVNQKGVTENDSEKMAREMPKAETLACQLENPQLPSYYNVHKNLSGRFLESARKQRQAGDLTGALESVRVGVQLRQKLLGSHPCTASSYFEQGNIYFAMGDSKSAVEAFQKAANMSLNLRGYHIITANYYFHLGKAQYKMPDLQGALKSLQRASNMTSHPPQNSTNGTHLLHARYIAA